MKTAYNVLCNADDPNWLNLRKGLVTGSDVAAMLGESKYKSRNRLLQEKAGLKDDTIRENKYMWFGRKMERANMLAFSELSGIRVRPVNVLLGSKSNSRLGATLDGLALFPERGIKVPYWNRGMYSGHFPLKAQGLGLIEMKNIGEKNLEDWSSKEPPKHYWWQVQAQLAVSGLPWSLLVAKIGAADMRAYFIPKDDFSCDHISDEVGSFWSEVNELEKSK